jgi:DNA-binding transcriptional LysR family regulator
LSSKLDRITLKQLRALSEVAASDNIVTAAKTLGLTGPAVHSQLRTLQEALGVDLLAHQGRRKNSPTPEGAVLLAAHERIRAILERALAEIDDIGAGLTGTVVLGAVSTAKYFAPHIVARLQTDMPELQITLKIANRQATIAALARGEFDLCIMGRPPREPLVEAVTLGPHPHVIVAAPGHPITEAGGPLLEELVRHRFLLREEGSGTRALAIRFLTELPARLRQDTIVMDSNETIKQAVMSGLGIALISAHTVVQEVMDGRLAILDVQGTPLVRQWFLLHGGAEPLRPAAARVHDWLVARADELLPRLPGVF